jgi:carbonic anhydrase
MSPLSLKSPPVSRRFFGHGLLFAPALALTGPNAGTTPVTSDQVLQQLLEGNRRFVAGQPLHPRRQPEDFRPLAAGQKPRACLVACADSRVAPELLFDQGVGDLFVIRLAGNYVDGAGASVKGSIEYAVAELGVPLILVLGHSECGAVKAAIQHLHNPNALPSYINQLVNQIKPAVTAVQGREGNVLANAIASNVTRSVARLKTLDPILAPRVKAGTLQVAGAVYDLSTGGVSVLDDKALATAS